MPGRTPEGQRYNWAPPCEKPEDTGRMSEGEFVMSPQRLEDRPTGFRLPDVASPVIEPATLTRKLLNCTASEGHPDTLGCSLPYFSCYPANNQSQTTEIYFQQTWTVASIIVSWSTSSITRMKQKVFCLTWARLLRFKLLEVFVVSSIFVNIAKLLRIAQINVCIAFHPGSSFVRVQKTRHASTASKLLFPVPMSY